MSSRLEPKKFNPTDIHENCMDIFEKKQWVTFFEKFDGYNEQVSLDFAETFDGEGVIVGNLHFRLSEDILAQIIGLPQQGERFFKTKQFKEKHGYHFCADQEQGQ